MKNNAKDIKETKEILIRISSFLFLVILLLLMIFFVMMYMVAGINGILVTFFLIACFVVYFSNKGRKLKQ